jgi:chromosome segregation ATPase
MTESKTKIESLRRMQAARQKRKLDKAAAVIQAVVRGMIQRPKYRIALKEEKEISGMKEQINALKLKLVNAEEERATAVKEAEDRMTKAIASRKDDGMGSMELQHISLKARLEESEKVLDFLKRERKRLMGLVKTHKGRCERVEEQNKEYIEANNEIRLRMSEVQKYMDILESNKSTLASNKEVYIDQIKRYRTEIQRGLAFKQNEEEIRCVYQDAVERIVALVQEECKNDDLVDDIYLLAMECEGATTLDDVNVKKSSNKQCGMEIHACDYDEALDDLADLSDCESVSAY